MPMEAFSCPFQPATYSRSKKTNASFLISCSMQPSQSNIKVTILLFSATRNHVSFLASSDLSKERKGKLRFRLVFSGFFSCIWCCWEEVVINGAAKEIGRAAVVAVTKARGMEVAGAVDSFNVGEDAGKVADMEEPLEIPIISDLTMVLGSISQSKEAGVVVDFTEPSKVYENVKQATAFGMRSVVYVPKVSLDTVAALSAFCEKASMGCLIAPTLSVGSVLLQQAAIQASFHYNNVEIVESRPNASDLPSSDAIQIANNLSNLGQIYNREDLSTEVLARGQVLGEDGVRVHSLVLPGLPSSTTVHFSGPGEVYSIRHDITDVRSLMPGLLLAIRRVVRLKNLVYGLEKFL